MSALKEPAIHRIKKAWPGVSLQHNHPLFELQDGEYRSRQSLQTVAQIASTSITYDQFSRMVSRAFIERHQQSSIEDRSDLKRRGTFDLVMSRSDLTAIKTKQISCHPLTATELSTLDNIGFELQHDSWPVSKSRRRRPPQEQKQDQCPPPPPPPRPTLAGSHPSSPKEQQEIPISDVMDIQSAHNCLDEICFAAYHHRQGWDTEKRADTSHASYEKWLSNILDELFTSTA